MNPYFIQTLENFGEVLTTLAYYATVEADDRVRIISNNMINAEEKINLAIIHLAKAISIVNDNGPTYDARFASVEETSFATSQDKAFTMRETVTKLYRQIECNYNPRKQMPRLSLHIGAILQYLCEAESHLNDYINEISDFYTNQPVKNPR